MDAPVAASPMSRLEAGLEEWFEETPRELSRAQLERSERHLVLSQRVGGLGSWEEGVRCSPARWSPELYRLLDIRPGDVVPGIGAFYERVHPDDLPTLAAEVDRAALHGGPLVAEVRLRPQDPGRSRGELSPGPARVVVVRGVVELGPDGADSFGTIVDVSDLRDLQHELRDSKDRFRAAFEQAPTAMALVDGRPGREWRLLDVNQALVDLVGRDREALLCMSTVDLLDDQSNSQNAVLLEQFRTGAITSVRGIERRLLRPDGGEVWVSLSTAPVCDPGGQPSYFVSHLVDITQRRATDALAREYADRDRRIATVLQDDLRPYVPARVGPLAVATRYLPGVDGRGDTVGGDWHDVLALPDGRIGVVIGDVAGHGVESAAGMSRLRHGVRMLASGGFSPAGVIRRLNDLVHDVEPDHDRQTHLATLVFAQLDPVSGIVRYSNAGHPPMIILSPPDADGKRRALPFPAAGEPPLGVLAGHRYAEQSIDLDPDAVLIGFTDGLIERRGTDLDETYFALLSGLDALPETITGDVEALADAILDLAPPGPHDDDIAVIVLAQVAGEPHSAVIRHAGW